MGYGQIPEGIATQSMSFTTILFSSRSTVSQYPPSTLAKRTRDLIREICASEDVEILKGNVSQDHVHLMANVTRNPEPIRFFVRGRQ